MPSSAANYRSRLWQRLALALVAVLALVAAAFALTPPTPTTGGEAEKTWSTLPLEDERPIAVVMGGFAAAGAGASGVENRWSTLLAKARNWEEANLARAGTGYVTSADGAVCGQDRCPSMRDVVAETVGQGPQIVVVSGGEQDQGLRQSEVAASVASTYQGLRAGLPNATIVAVGPAFTTQAPDDDLVQLDLAVQQAAAAAGATYVSLMTPNVLNPSMVSPDGVTINDEGHAAIAARISAAL